MSNATGVIIVAYNSKDEIVSCLDGCLMDATIRRIVVVDNSRDAATGAAVETFGHEEIVEYVAAPSNLGYARAANLGASRLAEVANLTHIVILNPDVTLSSPISEVIERVGSRSYSILSTDINRATEATHARYATTARTELRKALLGASAVPCVPRPAHGDVVEVPEVSGALMVMRTETFASLGGFDERFELYYEDVDLCQRAAGVAPLVFVGLSIGHHTGGASYAGAVGPAYRAFRVSRLRFLQKRYGMLPGTLMGITFGILEIMTRSATFQPEGFVVRWRSFLDQLREVRRPGTVAVLSQAR